MKIGLISDIHGDIDHLHHALDLLHRQGAEQILCTGDLVSGDPHHDAVIALLQERNIPCTLGNHDEIALHDDTLLRKGKLPSDAKQLEALEVDILTPASAEYLAKLLLTETFLFEEQRVLLTHATPWNHSIHVFSYSSREILKQVANHNEVDCVIIGHTHEPMQAQVDGVWIFNPGSVRKNRFEDHQTCAMLTLPDFDYTVYELETGSPLVIPFVY